MTKLPHKIHGSGGKSGGESSTFSEEANNLEAIAKARVVDVLSMGPIAGLVGGMQSVFLDNTQLANDDWTYNFSGVTVYEKRGSVDQSPLPWGEVAGEVSVSSEITYSVPVTRTVEDGVFDHLRLTVGTNAFMDQSSGNSTVGCLVWLEIQVKPAGGTWVSAKTFKINGKSSQPYQRSITIKDFKKTYGEGPWLVRVKRLTADSTSSAVMDKVQWISYATILNSRLFWPNVAYVGVEVDAKQFGSSVPTRSYEIYGFSEVHVPTNYDRFNRKYVGIWDGTFRLDWTDNPAWVFFEVATNPLWGLGKKITPDRIDKWALYEIGKYCDELVPDGLGNMEPRFTCNLYLQTQEQAYNVLNALAGAFSAMPYWGSGWVTLAQDSPADPTHLACPANVENGEFGYSGTGLSARASAVYVTWNNPDMHYQSDILVVEDPELIAKYGYIKKDVVAVGCTRRSQAMRYGKMILETEKRQPEAVVFKGGFEFADCAPGSIIKVADPAYAGVRFGGRVTGQCSTTHILLDADVTLDASETYTISVVMPDKTIVDRAIITGPGTVTEVKLESALPDVPIANAIWVITGSNVAPRLFRCISNTESKPGVFEISAIFYDPDKYARVEQDLKIADRDYSDLPTGQLPTPTDLEVTESLRWDSGRGIVCFAVFKWKAPSDRRIFRYRVWRDSGMFGRENLGTTLAASMEFDGVTPGTYTFYVRAESYLGEVSSPSIITKTIWGKLAPPSDVSDFHVNVLGSIANLTWSGIEDLDLSFYRIKYCSKLTGATWENSTEIATCTGTSFQTTAMVGTFLIKAVDDGGRESTNANLSITSIAEIEGMNVIEVIEDTTFEGTKLSVAVTAEGMLILDGQVDIDNVPEIDDILEFDTLDGGLFSIGAYILPDEIDLGGIFISRVTFDLTWTGFDFLDQMDLWPSVDDRVDWDGGSLNLASVKTYVRYRDSEAYPWSEWKQCISGDFQGRYLGFMVELASLEPHTTPSIEKVKVSVDMPDRVDTVSSTSSNMGDTVITYSPAFHETPKIGLATGNMATGDYYVISNESRTGFTINFYNSSGARIQRAFMGLVKGWGYEK